MREYIVSIEMGGQELFLTNGFGYESVPHRARVFTNLEEIQLIISQDHLIEKNPKVYKLPACEEVVLWKG